MSKKRVYSLNKLFIFPTIESMSTCEYFNTSSLIEKTSDVPTSVVENIIATTSTIDIKKNSIISSINEINEHISTSNIKENTEKATTPYNIYTTSIIEKLTTSNPIKQTTESISTISRNENKEPTTENSASVLTTLPFTTTC